ncbi:hypothetical protein NVP1285O_32 [Vibrio phage 1.285.O._10N.286.55.C12]|nr:hypothetical protein NVP1285O_32 [Vibrio phage 1.285.O._10N.286.55.C12]
MKINTETAKLITLLVHEIQGVTHMYDEYLDFLFLEISKGKDLTNVNPETVKRKACEICGMRYVN